jgi:teichuronic acid exporter
MKLHTELLRGLKWTAGAKLGSQVITWGITIYVMRLLNPSDYGLLSMATVFLALLGMFAEVGLGPALVQKTDLTPQTVQRAYGVIWSVNLVLFALLNLGAELVAGFYSEPRLVPVLRVLSLQFLVIPFGVIPEVMLQRKLEYKWRSLIELATAVTTSFVTLGMALTGHGVWALVAGMLSTVVCKAVLMNCVSPYLTFPSFTLGGMRQLVVFAGNVTGSRFLWFFFTQADTVIVGRLLGEHVLGLYSVAMHLASLPVQRVSGILNQVAFPAAARFQHDRAAIGAQLLKAIGYVSLIAFPILWGMSAVAPELLPVLLGPDWGEAVLPFQILPLVMPFRMIVGFLPTVTDAIGRSDVALRNALLGCVVMPVAFYIGSRWGIAGVAYAWLAAYPVVLFLNLRRMLAVIGIPLATVARQIAPALVSAGGMVAVVWATRLLWTGNGMAMKLAAEIVSGVIGYTLFSLVCNRALVSELLGRFWPGRAALPAE